VLRDFSLLSSFPWMGCAKVTPCPSCFSEWTLNISLAYRPTICLYKAWVKEPNRLFLFSQYPKNENRKIYPAYRVNFYQFLTDSIYLTHTNIQNNPCMHPCAQVNPNCRSYESFSQKNRS
jgi:hypothetical protein